MGDSLPVKANQPITAQASEPTPRAPHLTVIPPTTISPYLTLAEAVAYARASKRTIQRGIKDDKLTRYGHSKRPLIHRQELEQFLAPIHNPKKLPTAATDKLAS